MTDDDNGPRYPPGGMELVYMQVADDIARRIAAGEWGHGDRLPSREQLAAEYGAAQMTIRRAQRELAERGLIRVVQGKGAYATPGGTPGAHGNDDPLQSTTNNDG